jgi:HSP20 family molecular chaperone IbpA
MHTLNLAQGDDVRSWQRRIQDIMDEMRNRSFCGYRPTASWLPNINIYESRAAYQICVELAGLERETVTIECTDPQHVAISGERVRPSPPDLEGPYSFELMEIDEGPFRRVIDFGEPVDVDPADVHYDNGYLWVVLRKVGR